MSTSLRRSARRAAVLAVAGALAGAVVLGAGCAAPDGSATAAATPSSSTRTLVGSNVWEAPGEDRRQALARIDASYGPIPIARVFAEWLPPTWRSLERDLGHRPLVVSFRPSPQRVLAGAADQRLRSWFAAAPRHRDTYWVYLHEPEDEVEQGHFTAEEYAAAWQRVAGLAEAAGNPRLHATVVLMAWTADARSGRDWTRYVPHTGEVDVLAWDGYAKGVDAGTYADPAEVFDETREASASLGAAWAIAEVGAEARTGAAADRAAWITAVGDYARSHGARFVTWFDASVGGSFRLTDRPSIDALARLVATSRRDAHATERRRGRR